MITYRSGDILAEDADALVNTVNCVGYMGRGIALQFKKAWPDNFKAYAAACRRSEVMPGKMFIYATRRLRPRYIINFPTKRHWRSKSRIEDIEAGLRDLVLKIKEHGIDSIAIPPLGAGLGGLDWSDVRNRIETALQDLPNVDVHVYEPTGTPAGGRGSVATEVPRMTPGRAALVGLMARYLRGLLDPFISLLEVHKLMYFMQEAGEPLKLRVVKGPYGPYAENLRHVLHAVEGHFVAGFGVGGDYPAKQLELVPGAEGEASDVLLSNPETLARFDRVTDLVRGFESPFGLELLATVHWVMTRESANTEEEVLKRTREWGPSKAHFTDRQIRIAQMVLAERQWV